MKLAVIAPPRYQHLLDAQGMGYHFVLGQELIRSQVYREQYKARRLKALGQFVIVDNGAAENEVPDFMQVAYVAKEIQADEIILQDVLTDSDATVEATVKSAHWVQPRKRFIVPQGTSVDEWMNCLYNLEQRIAFATIGIPKHMDRYDDCSRPQILRALVKEGFADKYNIHLLGINAYPYMEVESALQAYPEVRGIDTGAPVAYAQHGMFMNDNVHVSLQWEDGSKNPVETEMAVARNIAEYRRYVGLMTRSAIDGLI